MDKENVLLCLGEISLINLSMTLIPHPPSILVILMIESV